MNSKKYGKCQCKSFNPLNLFWIDEAALWTIHLIVVFSWHVGLFCSPFHSPVCVRGDCSRNPSEFEQTKRVPSLRGLALVSWGELWRKTYSVAPEGRPTACKSSTKGQSGVCGIDLHTLVRIGGQDCRIRLINEEKGS